MRYILLSEKSWHKPLFEQLKVEVAADWLLMDKVKAFTFDNVSKFMPDKLFIPHWSYIISPEIFNNFECIVFHMTDLPFGRGGSPLQNLIDRGLEETIISAMQVEKGIDSGKIYLKRKLLLHGSAIEIFIRSTFLIQEMIKVIHSSNLTPLPQQGEVVEFKRRLPEQSDIGNLKTLNRVYDYIRMLDCDGYPPAFVENEYFRFEFSRVAYRDSKILEANVRIFQK